MAGIPICYCSAYNDYWNTRRRRAFQNQIIPIVRLFGRFVPGRYYEKNYKIKNTQFWVFFIVVFFIVRMCHNVDLGHRYNGGLCIRRPDDMKQLVRILGSDL